MDTDLGGLDRIELIMDGGGRTGEVVDLVDLDIKREADIVTLDLEMGMGKKMGNIGPPAGIEIIDTEHFMAAGEESLAEM
jgi:hypothetical protein